MAAAEPEFTLGIEEEYFLVDRATRDVVERPAARDAGRLRGVAGGPGQPRISALADRDRDARLREPRRGARRSPPSAPHRRRGRGPPRHGADRRGDPSLRPLGRAENHRAPPLRRSAGRSARGRPPARDLRAACPYRHPRRRIAHRFVEPGLVFPAASAGVVDLLAVLARRQYRAQILPPRGVRRIAAHRHARAL